MSSCRRRGSENRIKLIIQRSSWLAVAHRRRTWHQGVINLQPCSGLSRARLQNSVPVSSMKHEARQEVISCVISLWQRQWSQKLTSRQVDPNIKSHSWAETAPAWWVLPSVAFLRRRWGAPAAFRLSGFSFSRSRGFIGLGRICSWPPDCSHQSLCWTVNIEMKSSRRLIARAYWWRAAVINNTNVQLIRARVRTPEWCHGCL